MELNALETGDILLFDETPDGCCISIINTLIKFFTNSIYSHVGIILKNPPWIKKPGLYVWESTYHGIADLQDNKIKFGVQITPIHQYIDNYPGKVDIYVRKCTKPEMWTTELLESIHNVVYGKKYDILPQDWVEALIQVDLFSPRDTVFFCSSLVTYMLVKGGFMNKNTNWTKVSPQQLSSSCNDLLWNYEYQTDKILDTK